MVQLVRNIHDNPGMKIPIHTGVFVIDSPLIFGRTIADLEIRKLTGCTVLAVRREGKSVKFPDINLPLLSGDKLTVVGTNAQLLFFEQAFGLSREASKLPIRAMKRIA